MALSRDDFATAYAALAGKARTVKDVRAGFRDQFALLDKAQRKSIAQILGVDPARQVDIRSDPAALDALGEMLIEIEVLTEPELEKLVASYLSRTYRKSLSAVPIPPALSRFDFEWEIGRGRTGTVYRARRAEEPHEVAIKLFRPEAKPDPQRAQAMVALNEPGLLRVYEAGDDYLVMESVEGDSIDALLAEHRLSLRHGFELIAKAARVLAPLHARGLAHGSLGPGALLVAKDESVHVAELGLKPGAASDDVFALGAILYEIAAGVPPYEGFHSRDLRPPSRYNPSAGGTCEAVIFKALARDPGRRYRDAGELADDLGRWLRHEEVRADVTVETVGSSAPPKRSRLPIVAGAIAAVVLVALVLILGRGKKSPKPDEAGNADTPKRTATHQPPDGAPPPDEPPKKPKPKPVDPKKDEIAKKGPIGKTEEHELRGVATLAMSKSDYDTLIALGEEFLLRGADRHYVYHWLALGYRGKKEYDKAVEAIDSAIAKAPEEKKYVELRLPLLLLRGEARRALRDMEQVYGKDVVRVNGEIRSIGQEIQGGNHDAFLYVQRGALLHYKRNYDKAASDFHAAVQAGDSKALYFMGLSLWGDEKREDAIEALRQFLAAHPDSPASEEARATLAELEKK